MVGLSKNSWMEKASFRGLVEMKIYRITLADKTDVLAAEANPKRVYHRTAKREARSAWIHSKQAEEGATWLMHRLAEAENLADYSEDMSRPHRGRHGPEGGCTKCASAFGDAADDLNNAHADVEAARDKIARARKILGEAYRHTHSERK